MFLASGDALTFFPPVSWAGTPRREGQRLVAPARCSGAHSLSTKSLDRPNHAWASSKPNTASNISRAHPAHDIPLQIGGAPPVREKWMERARQ